MKNLVMLFLLGLFFISSASGQNPYYWSSSIGDDQLIDYGFFTVSYSEQYEQARWVGYELTKSEAYGALSRTNNFRPDLKVITGSASLDDYKGSGYDRGHLAPAGDMAFSSDAMSTSFLMSNMTPQHPSFNRGIWKTLEGKVREWAKEYEELLVITGPVFTASMITIGINKVAVPSAYFKAVIDYKGSDTKAIAFLLPNKKAEKELSEYVVSIDELEKSIGLDLFESLPDSIEAIWESQKDSDKWTGISSKTKKPKRELAVSVRCIGVTKAGTRCKNMTYNKIELCHHHVSQEGQQHVYKKETSQSTITTGSQKSLNTGKCQALTKSGAQCKRNKKTGSNYCWQHE